MYFGLHDYEINTENKRYIISNYFGFFKLLISNIKLIKGGSMKGKIYFKHVFPVYISCIFQVKYKLHYTHWNEQAVTAKYLLCSQKKK